MTLEPESVWYPQGKSRGSYFVIELADNEVVRGIRHDPGRNPVAQVMRRKTFDERYEPQGEEE